MHRDSKNQPDILVSSEVLCSELLGCLGLAVYAQHPAQCWLWIEWIWDLRAVGLQLLLGVPNVNMAEELKCFCRNDSSANEEEVNLRDLDFLIKWATACNALEVSIPPDLIQNIFLPIDLWLLIQNHLFCVLYWELSVFSRGISVLYSHGLLWPCASPYVIFRVK